MSEILVERLDLNLAWKRVQKDAKVVGSAAKQHTEITLYEGRATCKRSFY